MPQTKTREELLKAGAVSLSQPDSLTYEELTSRMAHNNETPDPVEKETPPPTNPMKAFFEGALARAKQTGTGIGKLVGMDLPEAPPTPVQGGPATAGYSLAGAGEMFLGGPLIKAAGRMLRGAPGLARVPAMAGMETANAALIEAANKGEIDPEAVLAMALAGGSSLTAQALAGASNRITQSAIGGKVPKKSSGTVSRYNLNAPSMERMIFKTDEAIRPRIEQVRNIEKSIPIKLTLQDVGNDAAVFIMKDPMKYASRTGLQPQDVLNEVENLLKEVQTLVPGHKFIRADLTTAHEMKTWIGKQGAFAHGLPEKTERVREEAANVLYAAMRKKIEAATAGTGLAQINKELSDLLDVRFEMSKRLPVEERANALGINVFIAARDPMMATAALMQRSPAGAWAFGKLSKTPVPLTRTFTGSFLLGNPKEEE